MFWLLVQHQDAELQRRLLPEMERAVSERKRREPTTRFA